MDTKEKKLKAIADAAAKKNISLDSILKYVEKTPAKTHDKKYQFVFHWIRLARPMYKKKGFSIRKVHIRLCKHPRFHYLLDGFYKASEKKKFNDKSFKDYPDHSFIKDLPTKGLYKRYRLCERLFKDTPLINKRFLKATLDS